jgi:hypothetical protein
LSPGCTTKQDYYATLITGENLIFHVDANYDTTIDEICSVFLGSSEITSFVDLNSAQIAICRQELETAWGFTCDAIDCHVSEWSNYGPCSNDCGDGIQIRTRDILIQPQNGGSPCLELMETQTCNLQPCPINCSVSEWSDYGPCSNDCGDGLQIRTRDILIQPENGGSPCPDLMETLDCGVSQWSDYGPCSKVCGNGTQTRTRTIVTLPQFNGIDCPILNETQACNIEPCPECPCRINPFWGLMANGTLGTAGSCSSTIIYHVGIGFFTFRQFSGDRGWGCYFEPIADTYTFFFNLNSGQVYSCQLDFQSGQEFACP